MRLRIKYLQYLLYRNVADDVLFHKHFTDLDYLHWFSRYERFCEPRYVFVNMTSSSLAEE